VIPNFWTVLYMCVYVRVCVYVCMYMYVWIYVCIYILYICVYIYIYVCVCVYLYISLFQTHGSIKQQSQIQQQFIKYNTRTPVQPLRPKKIGIKKHTNICSIASRNKTICMYIYICVCVYMSPACCFLKFAHNILQIPAVQTLIASEWLQWDEGMFAASPSLTPRPSWPKGIGSVTFICTKYSPNVHELSLKRHSCAVDNGFGNQPKPQWRHTLVACRLVGPVQQLFILTVKGCLTWRRVCHVKSAQSDESLVNLFNLLWTSLKANPVEIIKNQCFKDFNIGRWNVIIDLYWSFVNLDISYFVEVIPNMKNY